MTKKKITTIEGLAVATQNEFLHVNKRFDSLENELRGGFKEMREAITLLASAVKDGFAHVNRRIDTLHADISDLPVIREELRGLRGRVERLEHKVGVR